MILFRRLKFPENSALFQPISQYIFISLAGNWLVCNFQQLYNLSSYAVQWVKQCNELRVLKPIGRTLFSKHLLTKKVWVENLPNGKEFLTLQFLEHKIVQAIITWAVFIFQVFLAAVSSFCLFWFKKWYWHFYSMGCFFPLVPVYQLNLFQWWWKICWKFLFFPA